MNRVAVIAISLITLSTVLLAPVYAGGKGLKVNLFVDNRYESQQGVIRTYQHNYIIQIDYQYILGDPDGGWNGFTLHYSKGAVETGPFEVCVTLENDDIEACANGYNHEEKQPEEVDIFFGIEPYQTEEGPTRTQSQSQAENQDQSQSQSQDQTVIVCPANARCIIE